MTYPRTKHQELLKRIFAADGAWVRNFLQKYEKANRFVNRFNSGGRYHDTATAIFAASKLANPKKAILMIRILDEFGKGLRNPLTKIL